MLLDGLVERGLAKQQEAEANPHGQQPGHGEGQVCRAARSRRGEGRRGRVVLQDVSIRTNNTQNAEVMNLKPHAHVCLTDFFKMYVEAIILIELQEGEVNKEGEKKNQGFREILSEKEVNLIKINVSQTCCSLRGN